MIIDRLSGSRVHFEITVTKDLFEHALDHAFQEANQKAEIKGFRKGKAPREVFEAKFGIESLYEEAVQHAIQESYYEAVTENEIEVVSQPKIDLDMAKVKRGNDFTYEITVAVKPEVTLGQYVDIEVDLLPEEASEFEIEQELDREREKNAEMVLKEEGELSTGDTAVFDFSGSIDGEVFPGGSAENYELVIGSNQFIPGFEEQMIGMKPETERDIDVTFPEDYHEKTLAGKKAVFHVKLHEVKERVVPELDDDFVKDLNQENIATVDEYKAYIKNRIETEKKNQNEKHLRTSVIEKITANANFDLPEEMIQEEVSRMNDNTRQQIKQYNLDFNMYLQYLGKTEEKYMEELKEQASTNLRQQLVIEAIGKAEKIEATEAEIEAKYAEIVEQYKSQNVTMEQAKQAIPESAIMAEVIYAKTIDFLIQKAKVNR